MNFLRKILLIAIISAFAGNAECAQATQTIFDLPENTPGLMKDKQIQKVCGQDKACVHIVVPKTNAELALKRENDDDLYEAMAVEGNIYFPADGTQPTTEEAVKYSCANLNDDAVTNWYMQMFGVIDKNGMISDRDNNYVKAGWDNNQNPNAQPIISFDASVDNTPVDDPSIPGQQIEKRDLFTREFRKIASTSVGRVLLYRILIEIRRHKGEKGDGDVGNDIKNIHQTFPILLARCMAERNVARSLLIRLPSNKRESWKFNRFQKTLLFDYSCIPSVQSVCDSTNGFDYIVAYKCTADVCLFHELLHWYHFLRDPCKYNSSLQEGNNLFSSFIGYYCWRDLSGSIPVNTNINDLSEISLKTYGCDMNREKVSAVAWSKPLQNMEWVDVEELETILGNIVDEAKPIVLKKPEIYITVNGSDLSENLYRICVGEPLRFGISDNSFYEDSLVIERILSLYGILEKYYAFNVHNKRVNRNKKPIDIIHGKDYFMHWINGIYRNGLGKCRV